MNMSFPVNWLKATLSLSLLSSLWVLEEKLDAKTPAVNRVTEAAEMLGIGESRVRDNEEGSAKTKAQDALEKLAQVAASENRTMTIENAKRDETAAARRSAWGKFQPGVNLFAGQSRGESKLLTGGATSGSDKREYGINFRFNLFNGGADWANARAADRGLEAADFNLDATKQMIALNAKKAVIDYNNAAMMLKLAGAASASAADIRTMSLRKLNAGLVGKIDLHKTEVRESDAAAQVVEARLTLQRAKFSLLRACGIDYEKSETISELLSALESVSLPIPNLEPIRAQLKAPTAKLSLSERASKSLMEKTELEASAAYRKRWVPSVDLTASLTRDQIEPRGESALSRDPRAKSQNQFVGLELNWKLWAPTEDGTVAALLAARQRSKAQSEDAKDRSEVFRADLAARIDSLGETMAVLRQTWERASTLYDAQANLYQAGAVDIFEVINSETQRLSALKSWYQTRSALHLAVLQWEALELGFLPDFAQ